MTTDLTNSTANVPALVTNKAGSNLPEPETFKAGLGDFINGTAKADKALPAMVGALYDASQNAPDSILAVHHDKEGKPVYTFDWLAVGVFAEGTDWLDDNGNAVKAKTHANNVKTAFLMQAPSGKKLITDIAKAAETKRKADKASADEITVETMRTAAQAAADLDTLGKRLNAARKVVERACLIAVYLADETERGNIAGVEIDGATILTRATPDGKAKARTIKSLDKAARDAMRTARKPSGAVHPASDGTATGTGEVEKPGIGGAPVVTRNKLPLALEGARQSLHKLVENGDTLQADELSAVVALMAECMRAVEDASILEAFKAADVDVSKLAS